MVAGLAGEAALGLAIGVSLAIVIEVFQMAAQAVSLQAGLGYASTVDPTSGADSTVLLTIAQLTAGLLFFVSGADRLLVKALAESLRLCSAGIVHAEQGLGGGTDPVRGAIFSSGLRLAAPVIALLLLADASLAVLGRMQPQLHLISLTMPVKLAAHDADPVGDDRVAAGVFRIADDFVGTADRRHPAERSLMAGSLAKRPKKHPPQRLKKARKEGRFPGRPRICLGSPVFRLCRCWRQPTFRPGCRACRRLFGWDCGRRFARVASTF